MTSAHTPGPWITTTMRDKCRVALQSLAGNTSLLGEIRGGNLQFEANALLIASAPDLLAALEKLCALIPDPDSVRMVNGQRPPFPPGIAVAAEQARAVLAKARGES